MTTNKVQMRNFSDCDWYGYAGCEETDEMPAMIGEIWVDGFDGQVIVDLNAIMVQWFAGDWDNEANNRMMALRGTYRLNRFVAENLDTHLTLNDLIALGFTTC